MLTFNLKKEWFDKIKSGEKTTEYREVKPYWKSRIDRVTQPWSNLPHCIFRLGYTKKFMNAVITSIEVINGKDTDLHIDKYVYAIHFKLMGGKGMTRDEAIKQVCDILYGYEEVPEAMYENACNRVREIIQQIDKPPTPVGELHPNWTSWHKVSEEGLPTEAGLYALEFKDDGSTIREDYYNKLFTYVPRLKVFRYQNAQDYYDNQTFGFDKNLEIPVVAWQKITPYEG